jgi:tRNA nucleotidyltransferase (CCA-adding enzyme)
MKIYLVGGAVRDIILGIQPKDRDYVVVGASPDEMIALGYKQVGKDFPVFLHPETKEEYALARTERKVGAGYNGFESSWNGVTLEQDLERRDLSCNSIAIDLETNKIIDPHNGVNDINDRILRPTSKAFAEDPVRVLRVGKFLSRYTDFKYDAELLQLSSVIAPEIKNCAPERVWKEIESSLHTEKPSRMFKWLHNFKVFDIWTEMSETTQNLEHHPENFVDVHTKLSMNYAAKTFKDAEIVFACFAHDFGKPICMQNYGNAHGHEDAGVPIIEDFCRKWKIPNNYRDLAILVCKYHTKIHGVLGRSTNANMKPKSVYNLFADCNAMSKPERFEKILKACIADSRGRGGCPEEIEFFESKPYPQADYLRKCLDAVLKVNTKEISSKLLAKGASGTVIGEAIRIAKIDAIRGVELPK